MSVQHLDSVADYLKSMDVIFSTDVVFEAISLIQQVCPTLSHEDEPSALFKISRLTD